MSHRPVSAIEKYGELEALVLNRPECACHGETMGWRADGRKCAPGGYWRCLVKQRAHSLAWAKRHPEKVRAKDAAWHRANPDKAKALDRSSNIRRIAVGTHYFGKATTEEEAESINHGLREKAAAFREQQQTEYKEKIDGWINTPVA